MQHWTRAAALVMASALFTAAPQAGAEPPPVFTTKGYDAALGEATRTEKILIVKATAEWCGPCKMMDKTTWRDDKVVAWVKENGLAIQVDVDQDPALAKELRIRAMPTMVAFKGGQEFDRIVGYRDADGLLEWMNAVKRGERAGDALLEKAEKVRAGEARVSMQERLQIARGLVEAEEFAKATEEYLWLWENMVKREPAMAGVRGSFMASDMQRLAAEHEPAHEAFAKARDTVGDRLKGGDKSWEDLDDWIVLNEVVGEEEKTLAWFDRIKDDPESAQTFERSGFRLERLLEEHERWADLIKLYPDPVQRLRREHEQLEHMLDMDMGEGMEDRAEQMHDWATNHFRDQAGRLYGACLAADRADDAEEIAAEAVKLDDAAPMRAALVKGAVSLRQPRKIHRIWLAEAERGGEDVKRLRRDLEAALKRAEQRG